ncbi:MAG TPA: energy transducer TonB [Sphingomicrobium sp.]|nr:energy transducer TonB [Sphingomicrobium sp.]
MLAYAAHRRRIAQRHSAPHVMLAIIAGHIALIAAVMSARMDLPERILHPPTVVTPIPLPDPPPPEPAQPAPRPSPFTVTRVPAIVPVPQPNRPDPPVLLPLPNPGPVGLMPVPQPGVGPLPHDPVRVGPRFATPASLVKPPYPPSKLNSEEEAVLRLRLSIDARGRVVAVEPVGRADPAFLAAARRHLIAHWRYRPASEDGRAIASATVITLRFELEG